MHNISGAQLICAQRVSVIFGSFSLLPIPGHTGRSVENSLGIPLYVIAVILWFEWRYCGQNSDHDMDTYSY
jgi:hypothetical protein